MKFQNGSIATHNGKVTIKNTKTGQWRTFQIKTQPKDARFAPNRRIVALLAGSNNMNDYTGFGFVTQNGISVWRKKQTKTFLTFARMLERPEDWKAKGATYHFEGRCRRCNRTLTVPESIESGIGPICAAKGA